MDTCSQNYETLRVKFDRIVIAITPVVKEVASKCFAKSLISQHNLNDALIEANSADSRSMRLLSQVLTSVKINDSNVNCFVCILRQISVTKDLADEIDQSVSESRSIPSGSLPGACNQTPPMNNTKQRETREVTFSRTRRPRPLQVADPQARSTTDHLQLNQQQTEDSSEAIEAQRGRTQKSKSEMECLCPCGQCEIGKYLSNKCPKTEERYPYLEVRSLDEASQKNLKARLDSDLEQLCVHFASLVSFTCLSLDSRNISPEIVASCVFSIASMDSSAVHKPLGEKQEEELMKATSIPKIFNILRHDLSFFNYEILKHLICVLGTDQDKENLRKYLVIFDRFCQRSVFEVPPYVYRQVHEDNLTSDTIFAVKLTDKPYTSLAAVQNAGRKIAEVLGIHPACLFLCRVDKGCVQLVFLIPKSVIQEKFPLSYATSTLLFERGIKVVGFGSCTSHCSRKDTCNLSKLAEKAQTLQHPKPPKQPSHLDQQSTSQKFSTPDTKPNVREELDYLDLLKRKEEIYAELVKVQHSNKCGKQLIQRYEVELQEERAELKKLTEILQTYPGHLSSSSVSAVVSHDSSSDKVAALKQYRQKLINQISLQKEIIEQNQVIVKKYNEELCKEKDEVRILRIQLNKQSRPVRETLRKQDLPSSQKHMPEFGKAPPKLPCSKPHHREDTDDNSENVSVVSPMSFYC